MTKRVQFGWMMAVVLVAGVAMPARATVMLSTPLTVASEVRSEAQVKDDLLAGTEKFAEGASSVTDVNLDPSMMSMVGKNSEMAHKMDFIVVHTYEYDKPGMYKMEDLDVYRKRLADGSWNCFVHTREVKSGESTDICSRKGADNETNEMVIITAEPKELTFVHMKGRMSLSDLQNMNIGKGDKGKGEKGEKEKDKLQKR